MGITNHGKRVLSTFFLSLHLLSPSEHKPQKQNPMCYMFFLSWEVGREGQRGDQQLSRHQLHCMLFLRRNLDRQFANSKPSLLFWPWWHSQQVWSTLHPARKRFWGTPILTAQIHRWQERREIKKNQTTNTKKHRNNFQGGVLVFDIFIDFSNTIQIMP